MNKVCACIDGLANSTAVVDSAIWSARRLSAPLEFLHMIERHPERAAVSDHSGAIGLGAQESLLQALSTLDEERGVLAQEAGRSLLESARARAAAVGLDATQTRLRHGSLLDGVLEQQAETRLFVLGEHFRANPGPRAARLHLDHQVEAVVRAVQRPVLVVTGEAFVEPQRVVIAFDASATARKIVQTVLDSPMLVGLPALLAMATGSGTPSSGALAELDEARAAMSQAGFDVRTELVAGDPETVLPAVAKAQGAALLVMGAYGHSRIRHLIVGSTTTTLLRVAEVPVLILR